MAQLVQRVSTAAHGEELLVALDGGLALFQDALGQGDSGGVAGGILVNVERAVEVRDARPLILDLVVDDHIVAEIVGDKAFVQGVQGGGVQGFTALDHGVGLALELGKHRLAVDRALEVFQILVQQIEAGLGVVLVGKQLLDEQILVDGGRDLGDKQRVVRVLRRLMLAGAPAVDRVAHLMCQRRDTVQRAAEIQQDIGVGVIAAAGVRAAALAAVGVNVDPALGIGLADGCLVVLAQGCNGLQDHLLCGLVAVGFFQIADQRSIDVIEVQRVNAQHLFAQTDIAVHGGNMLADRGDEVVVDLGGHILPRHGHRAGRRVIAGGGLGGGSLDGTGVGRGEGVDVLAVALVVAVEGVLSQGAVRAHLQRHKVGAGDLDGLAAAVLDGIKQQVGVLQIVVDLGRRRHDLAEAGQQLFLSLGQGVGLAAQQILEVEFVVRDGGIVDDGGQRLLRQGQDLRLGKGQRGGHLDVLAADAGVHALGLVVAGVLVMALGGVAVEALDLAAHLGGSVEVCANRDGIGQLTGEGCQAFNVRVEAVQRGLPRGVALEHRGQVPLKLRVQFTAFF